MQRTKCRGGSTPHPPLRGPPSPAGEGFRCGGMIPITRTTCGIVSTGGASPSPTEVMLKHIEPVRAWGGGLILRGSTEEVKATGRPQVRTANGIRRIAEFKVRNRVPLPPFLKVLGFLRTFSKVLKWGLGRSPIVLLTHHRGYKETRQTDRITVCRVNRICFLLEISRTSGDRRRRARDKRSRACPSPLPRQRPRAGSHPKARESR